MAYIWSPALETGYGKIDEQHMQLFDALNKIADAFEQGKGAAEIFKTIDFLAEYTVMHFQTEEELMKKYKYPEYTVHKNYHDDFRTTVREFTAEIRSKGPNEELIVAVTTTVGDWLSSHIRVDDVKMAAFLESKEFEELDF